MFLLLFNNKCLLYQVNACAKSVFYDQKSGVLMICPLSYYPQWIVFVVLHILFVFVVVQHAVFVVVVYFGVNVGAVYAFALPSCVSAKNA